jgi:hypothetical protein
MTLADYIPTLNDIGWARYTLNLVADGGMIVMPSTMMVYRVSHKEGTLTLTTAPDNLDNRDLHHKTHFVFAAVGYKVLTNPNAWE